MKFSSVRMLVGLVLVVGLGLPATAAWATSSGPVTQTPASFTPWLLKTTPNQQVRQLVQCGDTMYAVGTISAVGQASNTYTRGNAFSFSATTGALTSWDPEVNGIVDSIALSSNCSTAYLGGRFSTVQGASATNLAAVSTATGALLTGFAHNANNEVETLQNTHGVILAGGKFGTINGVPRTHLASLDPASGAVTGYANLAISGTYPQDSTEIYNSQISHSGTRMLVEGVFTNIAGQLRQQVAILDLGATSVTLDGWYATELNQTCVTSESFYAQAANWSPDDSAVYIATTGYHGVNGPNTALCDAAAAFPATNAPVQHLWINYAGCDSYYAVAADANDVYVAGHERWADNPNGCDSAGPGSVSRPGLGALSPTTGQATSWNPTRARGAGADEAILTAAGLWIASDNFHDGGAQQCGGKTNHGGICFLPYQ
jgi:hypothetical protein